MHAVTADGNKTHSCHARLRSRLRQSSLRAALDGETLKHEEVAY